MAVDQVCSKVKKLVAVGGWDVLRGEMPLECVGTNIADVCSVQSDLRSDPSAIEHVLVCRADIIAVVLQAVSIHSAKQKLM